MSLDASVNPSLGPPGSWPSPISARQVAAGGTKVNEVKASHGSVWWLETRPAEGGRSVVVSAPVDDPSSAQDRLPEGWSSRSGVHVYGGGSWWLGAERLYFVSAEDQRIHTLPLETLPLETQPINTQPTDTGDPQPITPEPEVEQGWRYADGQEHPDGFIVVCVREDHHRVGEPTNEIVVVPANGDAPTILVDGADFFQCPRISRDGRWISWVEWDHPNMPWQQTSLKVAPLFGNGSGRKPLRLGNVQTVVTGSGVHGANWTSDGRLVYSSDQNGYWNLYWWTEGTGGQLTNLADAEIGYPSWIFGIQQWTDLGDCRLAATVTRHAVDSLVVVAADGSLTGIEGFATDGGFGPTTPVKIDAITTTVIDEQPTVAIIAATPTSLPEVSVHAVTETSNGSGARVVRQADVVDVDPAWLSTPESIWFESDGRSTQAFLYLPPHEAATLPPLIVIGHGGPTAHNGPDLSLKVQYWTSRGFAVADVNYGGSSGFGKDYRDRLQKKWGVVDVDDCVNAARHLAAAGLVDGERMAIRGSSSGGLTVMLALIQSSQFSAGVSLYGVTDLAALAADTHKFEGHYIDWLVGPYPAEAKRYAERSPSNHIDRLNTPMLLMQGTDDLVVPPSQAEVVVEALKSRGVPHVYVTFEGEGHGLRKAESLTASLEVELWFYGKVFGFAPADDLSMPSSAVGVGLEKLGDGS